MQNTTSETGFGRPRVRRGLGFLVGVTVALTPMAIAPAAAPAATSARHVVRVDSAKHVLRADHRSRGLLSALLGDPGGCGHGPVNGLGSLLSAILDALDDLLGGSCGPHGR
ncbi:MAG: hypothetical protein QOJ63_3794 [Solirubrobacteraceae bacterium]|nr:hypothetical protein [Solirubrobacteraceae bacterium]